MPTAMSTTRVRCPFINRPAKNPDANQGRKACSRQNLPFFLDNEMMGETLAYKFGNIMFTIPVQQKKEKSFQLLQKKTAETGNLFSFFTRKGYTVFRFRKPNILFLM